MLTAPELKALLATQHLRLTKRLGQHHLIDARAIQRIVEACELTPHDTVVEIGAGLGALTEPLARLAGRVIAVEVDRAIAALLSARMASTSNVTVQCQDILTVKANALNGSVIVGAIPYHITSDILVWLCRVPPQVRRAVLVVQGEVGQRLLASPGTKAYSRLSVLGQYHWDIQPVCAIPRRAFFPQPTVDSRCLRLGKRARPPARVVNESLFFEVVKAAFSQRRKTLVNCLSGCATLGIDRADVHAVLQKLGWPSSIRGEALSLTQFAALANSISDIKRPFDI